MSSYQFKTSWFPLLLTLGVLMVLLSLGFWQLQRGAEKATMKAAYEQRIAEAPIEVGSRLLSESSFEFFRAQITGEYEPQNQIFEDNRIHSGRPGYHVFTPFQIAGTEVRILVNRGWIPWGTDLTRAPDIETPTGEVALSGTLKAPTRGFFTLEDKKPVAQVKIWQNLDLEHYQSLHDFALQPMVLLLSPKSPYGGFIREWPVYTDTWIARHRGYAIQWFAMALVLVVVFLWATIKRKP